MTVSTVSNNIDVANIALTRIGEEEVTDLTSTNRGKIVGRLYDEIKNRIFTSHPWKFALVVQNDSTPEVTPPDIKWPYKFDYSGVSTLLTVTAVYNTDADGALPIKDWETFGDNILTNYDEIWYEYISDKEEDAWPPWFVSIVTTALAAAIARPITGNIGLQETLERAAYGLPSENGRGGLLGMATLADSQANPTKSIIQGGGDLIACRR